VANVSAVAFDGYGTIFDFTEPDFIAAMAEVCVQQGLEADAADVWRRFVRASYAFRSENHHEPLYRRYDEAWAIQFERVFKQLRLQGDAWAAAGHLRSRLASAPAYDEVYPVMEALRPRYRLALLSNADDDFLTEALEQNDLHFDTIVTSEQARAIKPNREIFDYLSQKMGLPPERIMYAGDNPVPDVLGPVRAGMVAAWVNRTSARRPRKVPAPHVRVRSLTGLLAVLAPHGG